jgi:DNA processing protein
MRRLMRTSVLNDTVGLDAQLHLLALCALDGTSWYAVARAAQEPDGLERLLSGEEVEGSREGAETAGAIRAGGQHLSSYVDRARKEVRAAEEQVGARLVTVLDDDYPPNLRLVANPPPFLFYRGTLRRDDILSVAVVGTRTASEQGLRCAREMAAVLVGAGVPVLSGLADGVDTAAHEATLEAGGRTIAVIGSGILRTYPAKNRALAERMAERGALVSQFWPAQPPVRHTFPRRNIVTAGMSQGTVVIEASRTSGARLQARLALQHGKTAFLVDSLVTGHEWARTYLERYPHAVRVRDVREVVQALSCPSVLPAAPRTRRALKVA